MNDERNGLTLKLAERVKVKNRWVRILSNKEFVTEKNINTFNKLIISRQESLSGNDELEMFSDDMECTMVKNGNFSFTLVVNAEPFRSVQKMWSERQQIKEIIDEYYKEIFIDVLIETEPSSENSPYPWSYEQPKSLGLQNLRILRDIFEWILNVYSSDINILKYEDILEFYSRKTIFCLFLWVFVTHVKKWEGTATKLLEEWEMFLFVCHYCGPIQSASVISRNLRGCKDILRVIGIGYEKKNKINRLWLINPEASNTTDYRSGRQIAC